MAFSDVLRCVIATEEVKSKSTSFEIDSVYDALDDLLCYSSSWVFMRVMNQVRKFKRVLLQVEKNVVLSSVFGRYIEGLIDAAASNCKAENDRFASAHTKSWRLMDPLGDLTERLKSLVALFLDHHSSGVGFVENAIVFAIALSIVFQYLVGYVDKGGTKTYNPGSLEFRATYVSLLLFQGAYVWIMFRDKAPRAVRRRHKKDKSGKVLRDELGQVQYYDKWEPRFKPPREKGIQKHDYLPLGGYDTEKDAEVVCQIAGFYYGKDDGVVILEDDFRFSIPAMGEQERSLCGEEKRKWVSAKAREVFELFKETAAREQAQLSAHAGDQVDARGSPSADQATVAFPTATTNGSDEFVVFVSTLAEEHGPWLIGNEENSLNFGVDFLDVPMPTFYEELNERLHLQKMQLEAEFNRRLAEEHQKYQRLEEKHSEVQQECKRLKTMLQQAATPLRAFFVTSTVELESAT